MSKSTTREKIIATADELFYRQGFEHTSFADIASPLTISRGNFYHHFKTKDDILTAVINRRIEKTENMLANWEQQSDGPAQRIKCYIHIVLTNWTKIKRHGCPVGSLTNELSKLNHPQHQQAKSLFTLFQHWLSSQFRQLGVTADADYLALQVLAWSQGVATLANTFQSKRYAEQEVARMCAWVDSQTK